MYLDVYKKRLRRERVVLVALVKECDNGLCCVADTDVSACSVS